MNEDKQTIKELLEKSDSLILAIKTKTGEVDVWVSGNCETVSYLLDAVKVRHYEKISHDEKTEPIKEN